MEDTDARLPFLVASASASAAAVAATVSTTVGLPRTQRGPEDATEEGDFDDGIKSFFAEITLVEKMAGLSVIRIPNQGLLTLEQLADIATELKTRRDRTWMATGSQIADWWREKERVSARMEGNEIAPILRVEILGGEPLRESVTVLVNLPSSGQALTLTPLSSAEKIPVITAVDAWRAGVMVAGLAPGTYRWRVQFFPNIVAAKK